MKVTIKNFDVAMELKNKGMEIDVYDGNDNHLGDLVITKAKVIWCKGKTTRKKGKAFPWKRFIEVLRKAKVKP